MTEPMIYDRIPDCPQGMGERDSHAYWYAWGRLDSGHPPVCAVAPEWLPNTSATAWIFGRLYAASEKAFADGEVGFAPGILSAWENFVASGGARVRPLD